jgi:hypothetical protein
MASKPPGIEIEVRPIIMLDSIFSEMHGLIGKMLVSEVRHYVYGWLGRKCPSCE